MLTPASQLYAVFATGFTTRFAVESALGIEAGHLDRYMAGEDLLSESQEIQLIDLLADYERRIRLANAEAASTRIRADQSRDRAGQSVTKRKPG